jgi:two-component system, sensor histidine kinase
MADHSASFYRDLLEFAPDALIAVNGQGTIVYANAHAHTLFGYEAGGMQGFPIERLIPEQSRVKHVAHRDAYIADPRTREMGNRGMPLLGLRCNGSTFRADIRLAPIHTPDGLVSAAAVRDATESERIVTMMATAKETADEANATKGRFLAAASHDLRQPLQTLRLLNGTLKRLAREPTMFEVLEQEERALGTMSELLNALLNVSKLESGTVMPTLSDVSLDTVFEDLRQQFSTPAKLKNLELQVTAPAMVVHTDSTLLREMVQNLLANAIRYTDTGRIALRTRGEQDRVWIDVEDTGAGMDAAVLNRIFDDFFQAAAHGSTHRGGVGLGLGIVRRLSRMLELPVEVSSVPGVGSRFSVEVTSIVCAQPSRPNVPADVPQSLKQGQRVLLVEDEYAMRIALRTYLQLDNHEVFLAASLREVDGLLGQLEQPPDIVISDFHLGAQERGSDAIERIRARFGQHVPAIVLTGDTSRVPAWLGEQAATRVLNKPVDVQILTAAMEELLRLR